MDARRPGSAAEGVWRLVDPKITMASAASLFLGAAAAGRAGPLAWRWLALSVLGVFFIEVAKNASGEVVDFDSGADAAVAPEDRSPFSGGKRVLVDGLLSRGQVLAVAGAAYGLAVAAGLAIVAAREPRVLWIGAVGLALAFFYHAPPLRLAYRGLGEMAVAACYGPLIAAGAYLVQRGEIRGRPTAALRGPDDRGVPLDPNFPTIRRTARRASAMVVASAAAGQRAFLAG